MIWLSFIDRDNPQQSRGNGHPDTCTHGLSGVSSVSFNNSELWPIWLFLLIPLIIGEMQISTHDTPLHSMCPYSAIVVEVKRTHLSSTPSPVCASASSSSFTSALRTQYSDTTKAKALPFLCHSTVLHNDCSFSSSAIHRTKPLSSYRGHRKALLYSLHHIPCPHPLACTIPRALPNSKSTTNSGTP